MNPSAWRHLLHELLTGGIDSKSGSTIEFLEPGQRPETYTYSRIQALATRVAASLQAAGLSKGDRVLVMLDNSVELVTTILGISLAGGVSVPINTATRGSSLEYLVRQVSSRYVFVSSEMEELYDEALGKAGVETLSVTVGGPSKRAGRMTFDEFVGPDHPFSPVGQDPADAACILYTSGSTGPPKGVICSHGMMTAWAHNANLVMDYQPKDRVFIALPVFHANALCCALLPALKTGASIIISQRFSARAFFSDLRETRATTVNLLGTMEAILRKRGISQDDRSHSVERALVIPAPISQNEFADTFGMKATTLYGLTDSGIPLGVPAGTAWPDGTCGRPNGIWETAVVDENDLPVAPGEPGFLLIRPNLPGIMMLGYLDNPDATIKDWRNLWFHTSDRVRVDEEGWFYFAGRSSDSIRRGGENISALEVEEVLNSHPAVTHSAVVPVTSEVYGQEVLAFLEGVEQAELGSIIDHCSENLPYFAVPRYFELIDELPRTPSEKIDKPLLKARGVSSATIDRGEMRRASATSPS